MSRLAALLTLSLFLFISTLTFAQHSSDTQYSFISNNQQRIYHIHLPDNLKEEAPLVFVLHGYGGSAKDMLSYSKMNEIADKHGFAVCYPQGYLGPDEKNSWSAGYSNFEIDDVGFISALTTYLQSTFQLSTSNVFCTGMSNGADMSYVLACHRPDLFKAIAPVAGCMMQSTLDNCTKGQPVSVFETHGTDDDITLWHGDKDYLPGSGGYVSVEATYEHWSKKNNTKHAFIDALENINLADSSFVITEKRLNDEKTIRSWLYTIEGGHHDWPGIWGNMDFSVSEEIWKFFELHID